MTSKFPTRQVNSNVDGSAVLFTQYREFVAPRRRFAFTRRCDSFRKPHSPWQPDSAPTAASQKRLKAVAYAKRPILFAPIVQALTKGFSLITRKRSARYAARNSRSLPPNRKCTRTTERPNVFTLKHSNSQRLLVVLVDQSQPMRVSS